MADAAEVFIKKNTTAAEPETPVDRSVPQNDVQSNEQVLPPGVHLYPPGVVPLTQQPCTEEDKKLVLALDKKVTAKKDASTTSAQMSAEAKQWNDTFNSRESMQNFINIYTRCATFVAGAREAAGMKSSKPVEAVKLPTAKTP